jgi:thiosulfate/3-mercaptopyruvate sulfurtransferase
MSLISAADLAALLDDPGLRIADVRWSLSAPAAGRAAYAEAHLPGAVFVDLDTVLAAPTGPGRHPLPDPAAFAAALGALGIGREHRVVAYDDAGGTVAARLWWMLDVLGHERAAVLDGGIGAWRDAGLPLTADVRTFDAADPIAGLPNTWPRTIPREQLEPRLGSLTLLDARAAERYRGEIEPIDPIAGHIPTAVNAPTSTFLASDGRFLPSEALAARFTALGATASAAGAAADGAGGAAGSAPGDRPVVVSCGSGVNACQLALAMRAASLPDPLLYPGSYSDWSRAGMPIATGDAPGAMPAK